MFLLSEIVIPEKCNRMYNNKTSKVKRVKPGNATITDHRSTYGTLKRKYQNTFLF